MLLKICTLWCYTLSYISSVNIIISALELKLCIILPDTAFLCISVVLYCMLGISNSDTGKCLFCEKIVSHTLSINLSPSLLFTDDRTCVIFPLVKAFCEKCFKGDEAVLASLSFQYGKLCHGLSGKALSEIFYNSSHWGVSCIFSTFCLNRVFYWWAAPLVSGVL